MYLGNMKTIERTQTGVRIERRTLKVLKALAEYLDQRGTLNGAPIEKIIDGKFPTQSPWIRDKLTEYGQRLMEPSFRAEELVATPIFDRVARSPECVVDKLIPQEQYDTDTLSRWVRSDPLFQKTWNECINRIQSGDQLTIDMVSNQLRFIQNNNYRSPARTYDLNGFVFENVANELSAALYAAQQAPSNKGAVPAAIRASAKQLFDIDTAKDGGPMDQPAYHIAILGKYRRTLQAMARAILIREGTWPILQRLAREP